MGSLVTVAGVHGGRVEVRARSCLGWAVLTHYSRSFTRSFLEHISGTKAVHQEGRLSPHPGLWTLGSDPRCPPFPSVTGDTPTPVFLGNGGPASGNWGLQACRTTGPWEVTWPLAPGVTDVLGCLGLIFVVQLSCERCGEAAGGGRERRLPAPLGPSKVGLGPGSPVPPPIWGLLPGQPWSIALEMPSPVGMRGGPADGTKDPSPASRI